MHLLTSRSTLQCSQYNKNATQAPRGQKFLHERTTAITNGNNQDCSILYLPSACFAVHLIDRAGCQASECLLTNLQVLKTKYAERTTSNRQASLAPLWPRTKRNSATSSRTPFHPPEQLEVDRGLLLPLLPPLFEVLVEPLALRLFLRSLLPSSCLRCIGNASRQQQQQERSGQKLHKTWSLPQGTSSQAFLFPTATNATRFRGALRCKG